MNSTSFTNRKPKRKGAEYFSMQLSQQVPIRKLVWVGFFGVAFGFVESSVVVYLRAIYYPDGFTWPLKVISDEHLAVELLREAATILMLIAVAVVAGKKGWQRFGYFLLAFGVWDIFYYVWLKAILDWPVSIADWDILFLIPLPWIGPVISALLVALLMTICGVDIVVRTSLQRHFQSTVMSWLCATLGTAAILYSFTHDTDATLRGSTPQPYRYEMLALGLALYVTGYTLACKQARGAKSTA
jgi:hypothetical protein